MRLAARGLRDMDTGSEPIEDAAELRKIRSQALRVHFKAFMAAALLTAILVVV